MNLLIKVTLAAFMIIDAPVQAQILRFEASDFMYEDCHVTGTCEMPLPTSSFSFDVNLRQKTFLTQDPSGWPRIPLSPDIEASLRLPPASTPRQGHYSFGTGWSVNFEPIFSP